MNYLNSSLCISLLSVVVLSCKKDSGPEPLRDVQEQTLTDDELLVNYLQTHFYNYEDFENDPDNYKIEISLDSITEDNNDKTALWDQVQTKTIIIIDRENNEIPTKLYYLEAKRGVEDNPSVVDSTFVTYHGYLLDGTIFDQRELPIWFNLASGVIRGFREFLPVLSAGDHSVNIDGTYELDHYGQGIFFIPSILGYYESNLSSIPSYSPIIFSVALHKVNPADHDNDGILSRDEDPDGDGDPFNDDTDEDRNVNFLDADDDNDGTPTKEEYDRDGDGNPDDDDKDGIPDYLDKDSN